MNNSVAPLVYKDMGTVLEGYCPFNDGDHKTGSLSYSTWVDITGDKIADVVCETKKLDQDGRPGKQDSMVAMSSDGVGSFSAAFRGLFDGECNHYRRPGQFADIDGDGLVDLVCSP